MIDLDCPDTCQICHIEYRLVPLLEAMYDDEVTSKYTQPGGYGMSVLGEFL